MKIFPNLISVSILSVAFLSACTSNNSETKPSVAETSTTAGPVKVAQGGLPGDFPQAEIPLVVGEVISGVTTNPHEETGKIQKNWMITINSKEKNIKTAITDDLTAKGFKVLTAFTTDAGKQAMSILTKNNYQVTVTVIPTQDSGRNIVYYNIVESMEK